MSERLTFLCKSAIHTLDNIAEERWRQHQKWGDEHLPDGTGGYEWRRDHAREICDYNHKRGTGTWEHILTEEYYEALSETEWPKLRRELIQVAAVCVAWIQDGDSRE